MTVTVGGGYEERLCMSTNFCRIGNVVLVILNLPLIPLWVQVLRIPGMILYPLVLLFCLVGAFCIHNNVFDILVMIFSLSLAMFPIYKRLEKRSKGDDFEALKKKDGKICSE